MPSPLGHMLGGIAAGHLAVGPMPASTRRALPVARRWWAAPALFGVLGALPDIDFLFGTHSTYTHSVGAMLVVFVAVWALIPGRSVRLAAGAAAAYGSHVLFDWMGNDTTPPIGIMALWPFSDGFYQSNLHLFMAISRRYWLANFWTHNLTAVALELVLVGPVAGLVWWRRGRQA